MGKYFIVKFIRKTKVVIKMKILFVCQTLIIPQPDFDAIIRMVIFQRH